MWPLLPGRHVVLWKQRDLQDLGVVHGSLLAGGGDRLPRHPVDLVEGMGAKVAVVRGADEHQQADGLLAVSAQLQTEDTSTVMSLRPAETFSLSHEGRFNQEIQC